MKYSVFYPTKISEIPDIYDDNIDVCLTLENGASYTVVFITPKNLENAMQKDGTSYIDPQFKFIVVERISENIIETVIQKLVSDELLLREYGL